MAEIRTPNCLICGAKETGLICHDCMTGRNLDRLIAQIEATPFDRLPDPFPGETDKSVCYQLIEKQLPSPWKEYFALVAMSSGRYYIVKGKTDEVMSLCNQLHQHGRGLDQYAANRAGGLLLYIKTINHDYFGAEEIAKKLYTRANMPYQAYYELSEFYMRTRRFDLAASCISRMRTEYAEDAFAEKWIDKVADEYNTRSQSARNYTPSDRADQQKLLEFLKSIGKI